jgi:cell division septation protein DedD
MMKAKNVQSIICLVIFFLFANQAWAADWIYYDTAAVGDMLYYDKSSIKKVNESIISVWTKNILSEETKTKYVSILKGIHKAPDNPSRLSYYTKLTEIDCVNKKMKGISVIFYDKKGKIVYSSPKGDSGEWNAILPNTVGEKLINIVSCEPVTPKEAVVAPKVEEPVTPKEAVVAPKVEKPATPKEAVVAPKVEEPVTPKEAVVVASPFFAAYSGHVASFKSEDNAVIFVNKMKAKGLIAFYQKENVPGKGGFYRVYIGRYKTSPLARKALTKLKKAGEIDFFQIQKTAGKNGEIVRKKMEIGAQKNKPAQKPENKTAPSIDTHRYYEGIKGIVLRNGKVIKGHIISIDDNDVLKIRTKEGKILSYSFMKQVKEYITE